jgi:hypothetical protein
MYYIKYLDMFRAILCSSSGGQNCISTASGVVTVCERPCSALHILNTIKGGNDNRIGHTLPRSCLLKRVIEGRLEVTGRQKRRRIRSPQLLDDLEIKRRYWKLKEEALDRTVWKRLTNE